MAESKHGGLSRLQEDTFLDFETLRPQAASGINYANIRLIWENFDHSMEYN